MADEIRQPNRKEDRLTFGDYPYVSLALALAARKCSMRARTAH